MPPRASTHKFQVELTGIKLPDEILRTIDIAIKRTVATELARLDFQGDYLLRRPREWLGYWVDLSRAKFDAKRFNAEKGRING